MPSAPVLTDTGIVLRPPRASDVDERPAMGLSPEILRAFGADPATVPPLTRARVSNWLDEIAACPTAWVIDHRGRFLGDLWLRAVNLQDRNARLGIGFYDPGLLGKGLGRAAIRTIFPHAFGTMALHRLSLRVLAGNQRAIRCYQARGFVAEGRERQSARMGDEWHDDVIMGCLATDIRHS